MLLLNKLQYIEAHKWKIQLIIKKVIEFLKWITSLMLEMTMKLKKI